MQINFSELFSRALGPQIKSFPYQTRLACNPWPEIIKVETGMGKTAGIILSWLFKRLNSDPATPRRLVYCLPMRVLVEQTATCTRQWIRNLAAAKIIPPERQPSVYILMGGEIDNDWDRHPERESILIGTQDQLLSRAINRGYATSRFRWPIQFGLLNNDCLWVMDEVQLMGSGLATTAQLQAFRSIFGTIFPVRSIWMSATLDKDWLKTIDFGNFVESFSETRLSDEDKQYPPLKKRFEAQKQIKKADIPANKAEEVAKYALDAHQKGTRTLVVVNTVKRAVEIYKSLKSKKSKASLSLVHSRFRPTDRENALAKLLASPGRDGSICVSTQVIEAGVDVSAATLLTDLAPWPSMVQRFGRCNRDGSEPQAKIFWLDIDTEKKGAALPYTEKELTDSSSILEGLKDAGPKNLPTFHSRAEYFHVLRKKDFIDLFDTTPDLTGFDIDISRFIRETEDHDVQVFWRDFHKEGPEENESAPSRVELCSVAVSEIRSVEGLAKWRWDHLEKRWNRQTNIAPGMILMLRSANGCYDSELGWTGESTDIPDQIASPSASEEANDDDPYTPTGWQPLADHNDAVVKQLRDLLSQLSLGNKEFEDALFKAARWHDAGKAHEIFQKAVLGDPPQADPGVVWGKTGIPKITYGRKGFRHELASALAVLKNNLPDLVVFLVGAHHGKVRLSIRSLPTETRPEDPKIRFARGIWDGDVIRAADLGGRVKISETPLDLSLMEFGEGVKGPSWLSRMLSLRDDLSLGPFRLAFLEALLRASDWRASSRTEGDQNA